MNRQLIKKYAAKLTNERGRKFSSKEAELEMVSIIQRVARSLASTYTFGYHSAEDIEQQGVLYALEVLESGSYDVNRPLENFLSIHVRNRLSNYKRNNYRRTEPPCRCCDPFDPPAYPCQKWLDWSARNSAKQNLMRPLDMSNVSDEHEINMRNESVVEDDTMALELRNLLDREIPVELRRDYLQMLDGKSLPKAKRERVREVVLEITKRRGYLDAEET